MKIKQKFQNVYVDDRRKLFTLSELKNSVYGEYFLSYKGKNLRNWDPNRSKLGAAIAKGLNNLGFDENSDVLYLGASSGTTVSHVSDILKNGYVFALDFAPRMVRDLVILSEKVKNIIPLIYDANQPTKYMHMLKPVDFIFQDIAQKNQVEIFIKNCDSFLKNGKHAILCIKSRSIDVSANPKTIFEIVRKQLSEKFTVVENISLEPYEQDHKIFLIKKN